MLMVPFFGGFASSESAEYAEVIRQVEENRVGGLILATARGPMGIRRSQVYPTAEIANELQRRAKIPLLIGADFESGTRMRHRGRHCVSIRDGDCGDRPTAFRLRGRQVDGDRGAGRGRALDLRARCGHQQQSRQSDHQRAVVWRKRAGSGAVRRGVRSRRGRKRRARDGEAFSGTWKRERRFAPRAGDGAGRSRRNWKATSLCRSVHGDSRGRELRYAGTSCRTRA